MEKIGRLLEICMQNGLNSDHYLLPCLLQAWINSSQGAGKNAILLDIPIITKNLEGNMKIGDQVLKCTEQSWDELNLKSQSLSSHSSISFNVAIVRSPLCGLDWATKVLDSTRLISAPPRLGTRFQIDLKLGSTST
ncbi:unnamed protein product [Prunus armeniaca]|uniref:Uncharacterized protein n=1 Tax=Prunus armeniaca TaxID=36596 RepID=A0A6J5TXJ8_PRUAR|nr:unnamed protein product [Prunus armeniaca]CAB4298862.1 unnamed protein product [Prunus armeniaca]